MATTNVFGDPQGTFGTLNGLFKEVYASKIKDLVPDGVKLYNLIEFSGKESLLGNLYHQPVTLGLEHGITFAGPDADNYNLLPSIASSMKDAEVKGNSKILRSQIGYVAISRSGTSAAAFMSATKYVVGNALRSFAKKLEIEMLYGQMGYGVVSAASGSTITVQLSEWAPGIWAGSENMPLNVRDASGAIDRGTVSISSVDLDTRIITLTSTIPVGTVATDLLFHGGAYGNEFAGIHKILTQTTGTLFNINVAQYNLFRGNQFSASGGALTFNKLTLAASRSVAKGQEGKLTAFINVTAWSNMMNDQAALRKYDQSYSKKQFENGSVGLVFHSQNGEIEIIPSIYVKEGYAYLLSLSEWMRVGSRDITFELPGLENEPMLKRLENSAGYEFRLFTDQAVFCAAPGRNVIITNIVNSLT